VNGDGRPRKALGQYFLRDAALARRIADATPPGIPVLEIGPGDGALTIQLLEAGRSVTAVELDPVLVERLQTRFHSRHDFDLITGNILQTDWDDLGKRFSELVVTGNLPFHLASPIMFAVFSLVRRNRSPRIVQMVIMVQREVGQRITGHPGNKEYGSLTLLTGYHGAPEYLFTVPADRFKPRPQVDGAVIRILFHRPDQFPDIEYEYFRRIVRGCFAQRRKMMRNALRVVNDLPEGWHELDYDFTRRPEQFTPEEFIRLAKDIQRLQRLTPADTSPSTLADFPRPDHPKDIK
jgi:16S rRNA (adenine1518-N6/adenine1519-N6)-dimethyltransferase